MISIVMSYYNRLNLLKHTLGTISESREKDFEIIIVDDFSSADQKLHKIEKQFSNLKIKIIDMADLYESKTYCNPCIPFNVGFRASQGDAILIQNPECCHVGDVLRYTARNLNNDDYLIYNCYGSTQKDLKKIHKGEQLDITATKKKSSSGYWYNHGTYRPKGYHFASAISRDNLKKINGFDERFAMGKCYDDDEFLFRIKTLGLNLRFVENPWVIHQWHEKMVFSSSPKPTVDNNLLFQQIQLEKQYRANNSTNIG